MASRIDPDPKPKRVAPSAKPVPAKSAAAKPAAKPSGPPPLAGKPGVAAGKKPADDPDEQADEEAARALTAGLKKQMPAWAISTLVHVVALLAMALMVTQPEREKKTIDITSTAPESEEPVEDPIEDELPLPENPDATSDVAEVAVPTDVTVVEEVKVVANANDIDAAPIAVDLESFSDTTAPASDVMSTLGAIGGTGTGFGGRANAAALAARGGGGGATESAVDRALKWLIAHQLDDGGWNFDLKQCPQCGGKCENGKVADQVAKDRYAATAMALLPFLGRGYTHMEGPYKKQLEKGIGFLANKSATDNGACYALNKTHHAMYTQGLAGIVLSEAYGMTQDSRLQVPAQLALNYIMAAQHEAGGWRYGPKQPGDTSVVGWQIMALKSGHMAYLNVDPEVIKRASKFLDSMQGDDYGSTYGYAGPGKGPATSAVGLLCRMYLGWKKDNQGLQQGTEAMGKAGPSTDLYYSYYATQVMHHMEGDLWKAWNEKMKNLLLPNQATEGHAAGSWYENVNGVHGMNCGRLYCTSLATLMLEVYYRHMPIYRNQAMDDQFKE